MNCLLLLPCHLDFFFFFLNPLLAFFISETICDGSVGARRKFVPFISSTFKDLDVCLVSMLMDHSDSL